MSVKATSDLWWKNAVLYCLDVETFFDSDGDGCGDLAGLTERVDYLAGLGVSCLWLMPFYPSPNRDDGYDITDFYAVDPRLGTLGDFVELCAPRRDRGIRVIADFVMNHTSDQHPWFQVARARAPTRPTATSTSGATRSRRRSPATSSSPTRRPRTGPTTARPGSTTCTASTPTSPTSTSPTRRSATSSRR